MTDLKNKTVLITGGGSGIGKLMGRMVLEEGAKQLIIWDLNLNALSQTQLEFQSFGYKVYGYSLDISDTAKAIETFQSMRQELGTVDVLINNAGTVVGKPFQSHSHEEIDLTMRVNTTAMMHLTKLALSDMIEQKQGHIVNIASAAGLVANPKMSVYCASKWAVIGWSDSLRLEMLLERTGVQVTTVTPFYIDTGMFAGTKSRVIRILQAEPTARQIVKAIKCNHVLLRMPFIVNILPLAKGALPYRIFDFIVGRLFGIYRSMDSFTGRK